MHDKLTFFFIKVYLLIPFNASPVLI